MRKTLFLLIAVFSLSLSAKTGPRESKTSFAREALQPYVDKGQLAGAISVFYKDGVQETCCIGSADEAVHRRVDLRGHEIHLPILRRETLRRQFQLVFPDEFDHICSAIWKFRRKVIPLFRFHTDPLFRFKMTPRA